ncbi:MAG: hypothetical protein ACRDGV_02690 [Candidatus Limnocylindria bacterium]
MHNAPLARLARALPILLCSFLAACAGSGQLESTVFSTIEPSRPVASAPPVATVPPEQGDAPITGEAPEELLQEILADAASRTGVEADGIEVVQAEAITWNDGSLGCPEPGMFYTQALVDGYHVIVEAAGDELDYRATTTGSFTLCEAPARPAG